MRRRAERVIRRTRAKTRRLSGLGGYGPFAFRPTDPRRPALGEVMRHHLDRHARRRWLRNAPTASVLRDAVFLLGR